MPFAVVVFVDIVGFTRKSEIRQLAVINDMTAQVQQEIGALLAPSTCPPKVVVLPTGDGMAVAIIETKADDDADFKSALSLAARLFLFAKTFSIDTEQIQIRVGIHCDGVQYLTDVNGRINICGGAINRAQRVMDAANDGQCLISESIKDKYLGGMTETEFPIENYSQGTAFFSEPQDVLVKHGQRMTVRVAGLTCDGNLISTSTNIYPISKSQAVITFTGLPKTISSASGFGLTLGRAKSVGLIQLTGENLILKLRAGTVTFSQELERLWVFMPAPEILGDGVEAPLPIQKAQEQHVKAWKDYLGKLRERHPRAEIWLGLFSQPPYFGASLLDWDRSEGIIHVSPYVWNAHARDCPAFDMPWKSGRFPSVAKTYVEGIEYLKNTTQNFLAAP